MKNWSQIKNILDDQKVLEKDQQLIYDFLTFFPFQKRQQLMGIFFGFSKKISIFIDLLKKKKLLAENYDENLAQKIFDLENNEIKDLINEINSN